MTGAGQTVAIIELGGGYKAADLQTYFAALGIKAPSVTAVSVDGARNAPAGDPNSADGEVLLDVEIVGAIAPGARIAVYFAPNTDKGFLDAITTAVHDTVRKPAIVSISWGGAESSWTRQALTTYDQAFRMLRPRDGVLCVRDMDRATGERRARPRGLSRLDGTSSRGGIARRERDRLAHPRSRLNGGAAGGATGGGVSDFSRCRPISSRRKSPCRSTSHFKGRGFDVSGDADPATGYQVRVDGHDVVFVAPAPLRMVGAGARINRAAASHRATSTLRLQPRRADSAISRRHQWRA